MTENGQSLSTRSSRRFKLEISYDGTRYSGWQVQTRQPNVRTIQGELRRAVEKITGVATNVSGSGRTDAGVHALYQVAAFSSETRLETDVLTRALNANLPVDIRVWRTTEVEPSFHPLRGILHKRYRYLMTDSRPAFPFYRNYVWQSTKPLDLARMKAAAAFLPGRHDFSAFQTTGSPRESTIRTVTDVVLDKLDISAAWLAPNQRDAARLAQSPFPTPDLIALEIEADGFLYNMVRAIAGTLYLFGRRHKGYEDPARMRAIVAGCDRSQAGPTAPPCGLYMIDVVYRSDNQ